MKTLNKIAALIVTLIIAKSSNAQFLTNNNIAITVQSGLQVTVQGDVTNQSATSIDNNGTINLSGNWINNCIGNCFGSSQGTVIFNGTNQTIGGSNITLFNNLVLQNSGTKTLVNDISVGGVYASPAGILDIGNAVLDLNSKSLSLSNSATTAITSSSGYILSEDVDNSSKINWNIITAIGAHTIPFGNTSGNLIPFTFNLTSGNAGEITVSTYATNASNQPLPVSPTAVTHVHNFAGNDNSANVVDRFWQIDATGNPTAALTFAYANSENAANGNTNMVAQRWVNPTAGWALPQPGQSNPTSQSVTINNVTAFGPWAVTTSSSPLPIVMLQFTAKAKDNEKVICNWVTASEKDNDFFNVERSKDGIHFYSVGIVDGSGNSNVPHSYSFTDENPLQGISNYRIKQTDYNGTFSNSVIRQVSINSENGFSVEVYPNPVVDFVNVVSAEKENLQITITDVTGKIIQQLKPDSQQTQIDFRNLNAGIYFIVAETADGNTLNTLKVVKQ